ncbi:unnamed protein product, partial [Effrenium voratum]
APFKPLGSACPSGIHRRTMLRHMLCHMTFLAVAQADNWQQKAVYGHAAVFANDTMYVFGGSGSDGHVFMSRVQIYSTQADGWQYVDADSPSLAERTGHTAVWSHTADGAYIFGGHFYFRDQSYFTDVVFYSPQA